MKSETMTDGREVEALKRDIRDLRDDVKSLAESLKEAGKSRVINARDRLGSIMHEISEQARQQARDVVDMAKQRGQDAVDSTRRTVGDKPLTSVLVAFAGGLLLSRFLFRR